MKHRYLSTCQATAQRFSRPLGERGTNRHWRAKVAALLVMSFDLVVIKTGFSELPESGYCIPVGSSDSELAAASEKLSSTKAPVSDAELFRWSNLADTA